jgi:hypothetical protein
MAGLLDKHSYVIIQAHGGNKMSALASVKDNDRKPIFYAEVDHTTATIFAMRNLPVIFVRRN